MLIRPQSPSADLYAMCDSDVRDGFLRAVNFERAELTRRILQNDVLLLEIKELLRARPALKLLVHLVALLAAAID